MTPIELQKQFRSVQLQRNALMALIVGTLSIIFMQSIAMSRQKQSVVLVPSHVSDGMVAVGARDTRYIEAIALDTIYALFNVSQGTTEYSRNVLHRVTAADQLQEVLAIWETSIEDYQRRKISTTFLPLSIEYQLNLDRVLVRGDLRTFIGNTMVSNSEKITAVYFTQEAGSYRVSGIQEINEDETE